VRPDQLDHAIRAVTDILGEETVIVIGSQSVLGSFTVEQLPPEATRSIEVDILPLDDPTEAKADEIDGAIGEGSSFQELHGFYVQGVGPRTATLPDGWRERLVPVASEATNGRTGLCLEIHDLCVSKLVADRDKDRAFCAAVVRHGLVSIDELRARLEATEVSPDVRARIADPLDWL
jgi:hypothetical protein